MLRCEMALLVVFLICDFPFVIESAFCVAHRFPFPDTELMLFRVFRFVLVIPGVRLF